MSKADRPCRLDRRTGNLTTGSRSNCFGECSVTGKVLIADDDPAVVSLLRRRLASEGYSVSCATNGREALDAARAETPDVAILDVMMPQLDGLDVCRELRRWEPGLAILLLTARDAPRDQVLGLDSGADDYLTKPFSPAVLSAHVRALLRRHEGRGSEPLMFEDLRLDTGAHTVRRGSRLVELTNTEFRLLELFMAHPRQVLTKEQIMERIWGYDFGGDDNIIEVYVRNLRRKLDGDTERRLIQTVRSVGYVLRLE